MEKNTMECIKIDEICELNSSFKNLSKEVSTNNKENSDNFQIVNLADCKNVTVGNNTQTSVEVHGPCTFVINDPTSIYHKSTSSISKKNNNIEENETEIVLGKNDVFSKQGRNFNYEYKIIYLLLSTLIILLIATLVFLYLKDSETTKKNQNVSLKLNNSHTVQIPFTIRKSWKNSFDNYYESLEGSEINNKLITIKKISLVTPQHLWFFCYSYKDKVYDINCKTELIFQRILGKFLGYNDIIYHYIIHMDGSIYEGRSIHLNNDVNYKNDFGNSTLIIGLSLCHSGNNFFIEKSLNESESIKNLINYLKNETILSENYSFELWDYCEGSLMHDKLKDINKDRVTLYNLKSTKYYNRYIKRLQYAGVNDKKLDNNKPCRETNTGSTLQNVVFPFIDIYCHVNMTYGDVLGAENETFNSYYNFVKERIEVNTYNIKYCNLLTLLEDYISYWGKKFPKYSEAKPNLTSKFNNYSIRSYHGPLYRRN